jgi:hypothetical protein
MCVMYTNKPTRNPFPYIRDYPTKRVGLDRWAWASMLLKDCPGLYRLCGKMYREWERQQNNLLAGTLYPLYTYGVLNGEPLGVTYFPKYTPGDNKNEPAKRVEENIKPYPLYELLERYGAYGIDVAPIKPLSVYSRLMQSYIPPIRLQEFKDVGAYGGGFRLPHIERGLDKLEYLLAIRPVILFCECTDPSRCHRTDIVVAAFKRFGGKVPKYAHIFPDGEKVYTPPTEQLTLEGISPLENRHN